MNEIIQTDRILIREMDEQDAPFLVDLLNSEGWLEFIGDRNVHTEEQAAAYIKSRMIDSYKRHGFGLWLLDVNDEAIGVCGIIKRPELSDPDLGFALLPDFMGQGFAIEAAEACVTYAEYSLALPSLLGITLEENLASRKVLEAAGLDFEKMIPWPDGSRLMQYRTDFN